MLLLYNKIKDKQSKRFTKEDMVKYSTIATLLIMVMVVGCSSNMDVLTEQICVGTIDKYSVQIDSVLSAAYPQVDSLQELSESWKLFIITWRQLGYVRDCEYAKFEALDQSGKTRAFQFSSVVDFKWASRIQVGSLVTIKVEFYFIRQDEFVQITQRVPFIIDSMIKTDTLFENEY